MVTGVIQLNFQIPLGTFNIPSFYLDIDGVDSGNFRIFVTPGITPP
jgi:hypothetical protein